MEPAGAEGAEVSEDAVDADEGGESCGASVVSCEWCWEDDSYGFDCLEGVVEWSVEGVEEGSAAVGVEGAASEVVYVGGGVVGAAASLEW